MSRHLRVIMITLVIALFCQGQVLATEVVERPRAEENYYGFMNYQLAERYLGNENATHFEFISYLNNSKIKSALMEFFQELKDNYEMYPRGSSEQVIVDMYQSSLDMESRNRAGLEPLRPYLEAMQNAQNLDEYLDALVYVSELGNKSLFYISPGSTTERTMRDKIIIGTSAHFLPDVRMWEKEEEVGKQQAFQDYAEELFDLLGYEPEEAADAAARVTNLTRKLAAATLEDTDPNYGYQSMTQMSTEELQALFTNVDIVSLIRREGLEQADTYYVNSKENAACVNRCLAEEDLQTLKEYSIICLLDDTILYGSEDFSDAKVRFNQNGRNMHTLSKDEMFARQNLMEFCGWQLGDLYVEKTMDDVKTYMVEAIASRIVNTYRNMIEEQDWLSDESKDELKEKLETLKVEVGAPPVDESGKVNYEVVPVEEGGCLLENVLNYRRASTEKRRKRFLQYKENDNFKGEWVAAPYFATVTYDDVNNSINVSAGILQSPFYEENYQAEANYGGVGYLIARNILKAFEQNEQFKKREEDFGGYQTNISSIAAMKVLMRIAAEENLECKGIWAYYSRANFGFDKTGPEELEVIPGWYSYYMDTVNTVIRNMDEYYENYFVQETDAMYLAPEERMHFWDTEHENIYIPWQNANLEGVVTSKIDRPDEKTDFYTSVNYDWLCDTEMDSVDGKVDSYTEHQNEINHELLTLLENHELDGGAQKYFDYYTDWESRNESWHDWMLPHIEAIENISTMDDLKEYLFSEEGLIYGDVFNVFSTSVVGKDKFYYLMYINTNSLLASYPEEYSQKMQPDLSICLGVLQKVLPKFGYTVEDAAKIFRWAKSFDESIAGSMLTTEEWNDPDIRSGYTYDPYTLEELKEYFTNFPIGEMAEAYGYTKWDYFYVAEPEWLYHLNNIFNEDNIHFIKAYLLSSLVMKYRAYADQETVENYEAVRAFAKGNIRERSLNEIAYGLISSLCSDQLSQIYIERNMTPEIKADVEKLVEEISECYKEMLLQSDWMSDEAKEKACLKLDNIEVYAAYIEDYDYYIWDISVTNEEGEDGDVDILMLEEYLARDDHNSMLWEMENTPEVNTEWVPNMTTINAYYSTNQNAIVIPAAILGGNFFGPDMAKEDLLANLGTVIAHEISHAFDANGSKRDENGRMNEWWTETDRERYQEKVDKLINYYDHLIIMPETTSYSGTQVQNEAIADICSMECILRMASSIEGFDYDRFFRSYAALYKSKMSRSLAYELIETDPHPFDFLRVNTVLSQFDEFQETYSIEPGDRMYFSPEERICIF